MNELAIPTKLKPVAVEMLRPDAALEFNLFLCHRGTRGALLFRGREYPLEIDDLVSLAESGIQTLYIDAEETAAYERYLREWVIADREIPPVARYQILLNVGRAGFLEALRSNCPDRIVENARQVAMDIVELISDDDLILGDLLAVMQHDYCAFTHAANVCAYCVALSAAFGIADRQALRKIAIGALLLDIGKRKLPLAILNKPGRLTTQEFETVKRHPSDAFVELAGRADLEWGQLMMVYQHHERSDGSGYPVGIKRVEIHPWAALCSVADVFDALTSKRPHRKAISVGEALEFLKRKAGKQFDAEIVQCWIRTVTHKR